MSAWKLLAEMVEGPYDDWMSALDGPHSAYARSQKVSKQLKPGPGSKAMRSKPAGGDPMKSNHAEHFHVDEGEYLLIKNGSKYMTLFIPSMRVKDYVIGEPTVDRRAAVELALLHHDKKQAGMGESEE